MQGNFTALQKSIDKLEQKLGASGWVLRSVRSGRPSAHLTPITPKWWFAARGFGKGGSSRTDKNAGFKSPKAPNPNHQLWVS